VFIVNEAGQQTGVAGLDPVSARIIIVAELGLQKEL
jgi:hypothetical protein